MKKLLEMIKQNKLFFKIFMYFLALLVPIMIIGSISLIHLEQQIKKESADKLASNLEASADTLEIYLSMIQSTSSNLYMSDPIQSNLRRYDEMTDHQRINLPAIVKAIASSQNSMNPIIDSIFMFIDDKKVYTSGGAVNFPTHFGTFNQFQAYDEAFWLEKLNATELFQLYAPTEIYNAADEKSRTVIPGMMTQYINGVPATIVTTISISSIQSMIEHNSVFPATAYMVLDSFGNLVFQSASLLDDSESWIRELASSDEHTLYASRSTEAHKQLITRVESGTFGWTMAMTVLRSPIYAHHDPYEPQPHLDYIYMDQGVQTFTYRLYPHEGGWRKSNVSSYALELNQRPVTLLESYHEGMLPLVKSFVSCSQEQVIVQVLKKAEDGEATILRCNEIHGKAIEATITLEPWERQWSAHFQPYEIKTYRIPHDKSLDIEEVDFLEWS